MTLMISVNAVRRSRKPRFSWLRYCSPQATVYAGQDRNLYAELRQLRVSAPRRGALGALAAALAVDPGQRFGSGRQRAGLRVRGPGGGQRPRAQVSGVTVQQPGSLLGIQDRCRRPGRARPARESRPSAPRGGPRRSWHRSRSPATDGRTTHRRPSIFRSILLTVNNRDSNVCAVGDTAASAGLVAGITFPALLGAALRAYSLGDGGRTGPRRIRGHAKDRLPRGGQPGAGRSSLQDVADELAMSKQAAGQLVDVSGGERVLRPPAGPGGPTPGRAQAHRPRPRCRLCDLASRLPR